MTSTSYVQMTGLALRSAGSSGRIVKGVVLTGIVVASVICYLHVTAIINDTKKQAPASQQPPPTPLLPAEQCHFNKHIDLNRLHPLDDILLSEIQPHNNTIFIHITACHGTGIVQLSAREACAIESTAAMNPDQDVFVIFAENVGFQRYSRRPALFKALDKVQNVHWRTLNLTTFAKGTPAEHYVEQHLRTRHADDKRLSDLLPLISLYRWGGITMTPDFIALTHMEGAPNTFVSEDGSGRLTNSVLGIANQNAGRWLATALIDDYVQHANMSDGRNNATTVNGSTGVERVVSKLCGATNSWKRCKLSMDNHEIVLLPKEWLFTFTSQNWQQLFDVVTENALYALVLPAKAINFWNGLSKERPIQLHNGSMFENLAKWSCENVYTSIEGEVF